MNEFRVTISIAFSSTNEEHGVPSYLRQPTVKPFTGWDCEPRGVLGFIEGYLSALHYHTKSTITRDDLGLNGSVRLAFEEIYDDGQGDREEIDTLVLSMSLVEAPELLKCWIETQSSKCLTWVSCDQVAEEFSEAKDAFGNYLLRAH